MRLRRASGVVLLIVLVGVGEAMRAADEDDVQVAVRIPRPAPKTNPAPKKTPDFADGASPYRQLNGVYAVGIPDGDIQPKMLSESNVDGIALRVTWKKIEPADNRFDWAHLDKQVAAAAGAGKKISLSVTAGTHTPAWVFAAGAESFTYGEGKGSHTIPAPWDPVFQARWQRLIKALGKRYAENPAVVLVKITGINMDTPECMLPRSANDARKWAKAGYTRQKLADAWLSSADTFAKAFPKVRVSQIVIPHGLPDVEPGGKVTGQGDQALVEDLVQKGIAKFGNQFCVENHGLSDYWISPTVGKAAGKVATGYQMIWWVTNDPQGRVNNHKTPYDPVALFDRVVTKGIAAGARFLEIYPEDIVNDRLHKTLATAHTRLRGAPPANAPAEK
jgi:hypothetical protein